MKPFELITYLSILLSLLVAYLYRKHQFKFFFLLSALNDFIGFLLWIVLRKSGQDFWIPVSYLLLFSINAKFYKKFRNYIWLGFIFILIVNYFSTTIFQYYFILVSNIILFFIFARYFIREFLSTNKMSYFYFALVLYEILIILNFIF